MDTYRVYHQAQKPVVARVRAIIARIADAVSEGRGVVFFGAVGTGKDHFLAALLYAAAATGVPCRWVNGQEVYGQFRDRMDAHREEDELFRELCRPTVLGISDPIPPIGSPSPWNVAQLYRLLDRRYRALKPTWVSLNAQTVEDADAKLSAPVFDRLREGAELIPCFWPSFRQAVARPREATP